MKPVLIIPVVVIAICFAASVHSKRKNTNIPELSITRTSWALRGIDSVLPVTTNLAFIWMGDSFDVADYIYERYLLAPRYCIGIDKQQPGHEMDTVICVSNIWATDSTIRSFTDRRKIIWESRDTVHRFILTTGH